MTEKIILTVTSLCMLAFSFKKGDKWTILLTAGLTIGILFTWIQIPIFITTGLLIYMLTAMLISVLTFKEKELSKLNRTTIILSGVWAFGANLFSMMQWPCASEIRLSLIVPIVFYAISLLFGMTKRKELGYLTILNVEFVLRLIR